MMTRLMLHDWLVEQEGRYYLWGSKGPDNFDCSGLVTCGLLAMGLPDWRATHSSARLYSVLDDTMEPLPMDLAFYGPPSGITHVMFVWGDGRVYGACGGNSGTLTLQVAREQKAKVQFRHKVLYRPGFRGFRRIPLL